MLAVAGDALGCLSEEKDTIRGGHIKLKTLGKGGRRERERGGREWEIERERILHLTENKGD